MKALRSCCLLLLYLLSSVVQAYELNIDERTERDIERILYSKDHFYNKRGVGFIIQEVSGAFVNMPYEYNTMVGSLQMPEALVVKFYGLDCFSMVEYVLALSRSHSKEEFIKKLIGIRYIDHEVDYQQRKHFFTDWYALNPKNALDVTAKISPNSVSVQKNLNLKADGSYFLPGIFVRPRLIRYIPSKYVNKVVLEQLQQGDFVGIYSKVAGLDASHVGIVVKKNGQVYYRNASSLKKNMKVVDVKLTDYIANKPGIIVLRAR